MHEQTIRLPVELKKQLQREAEEKGMPLKDLIIFILHWYLDQK